MDNIECFMTLFNPCCLIHLECDESFLRDCELCEFPDGHKNKAKFSCRTCGYFCCLICFNWHFNNRMDIAIKCFKRYNENDAKKQFLTPIFKNASDLELTQLKNFSKNIHLLKEAFPEKQKVQLLFNEELNCIFFSDEQMKIFLSSNCQFITLSKVCNLVNLELTLYFFTGQDSNGHCEIIGVGLLFVEDEACISWFCNMFKNQVDFFPKLETFFLDPCIQMRGIIQENFTDIPVLFSPYHSMCFFKSHLCCYDLNDTHQGNAVAIFKKMLKASTEQEFRKLSEDMWEFASSVVGYYHLAWHSYVSTWAVSLIFESEEVSKPFNLFYDEISEKWKSLSAYKIIDDVLKAIFKDIMIMRKQFCLNLKSVFQTVNTLSFNKHFKEMQNQYIELLTGYAGKLVLEQFNKVFTVKKSKIVSDGYFRIIGGKHNWVVTMTHCSCNFYTCLILPCWHILLVRKLDSLPLFDRTLCSPYWFAKSYHLYFTSYHIPYISEYGHPFENEFAGDNYKKFFDLLKSLFPHFSNQTTNVMKERCQAIVDLLEGWQLGFHLSLKLYHLPQTVCEQPLELSNVSIDVLSDVYAVTSDHNEDSDDNFSSVSSCSATSECDM